MLLYVIVSGKVEAENNVSLTSEQNFSVNQSKFIMNFIENIQYLTNFLVHT